MFIIKVILLIKFQGTYPIKPDLPAVGGGEGVGVVKAIGDQVKSLKIGDRVIPSLNMAGTWNTHMEDKETSFIKVIKQFYYWKL